MINYSSHRRRDGLVVFYTLTFAITWGIGAIYLLIPRIFEVLFGSLSAGNPLFILAVAGPTVAASIVTYARGGWRGLREFYAKFTHWRFGARWYALILLGVPLVYYLVSRVAGEERTHDISMMGGVLGVLLVNLVLGPLGEELGWRGFAFPRLLERFSPLAASLIFGGIWGVWHLPAFFFSGLPQTGLSIPVFLANTVTLAVIATWIYLHTGGSVPSIVLFHYAVNVSIDLFGTPQLPLAVVTALIAGLVVALDRQLGWFHKGGAEATHERGVVPAALVR